VFTRMFEPVAGFDDSQPGTGVFTNKIISYMPLSKIISPEWTLNGSLDKGYVDGRTSSAGEASLSKNVLRN